MSGTPSTSRDWDQEELRLRKASATIWKCGFAILTGFTLLGGIDSQLLPGILILVWAAGKKLCQISIAMSDHQTLKRKRTTNEIMGSKRQHKDNGSTSDPNNEKPTHPHDETSADASSLRSILVSNISAAQAVLARAQADLKNWDAGHQSLLGSTTGIPNTPSTGGGEEIGDEAKDDDEMEAGGNLEGEEENEVNGEENAESGNEDNEDYDELWQFRPVLASIRLENLPELASKLRQELMLKDLQVANAESTCDLIDCTVQEKPLFGSFNILFVVEFADGVKWLLKVPATATAEKFDNFTVKRMESEVCAMRLIKRNTTIPLPTVYAYDTTFLNAMNTPYIMMEMLEGVNLYHSWFDDSAPEAELEERRVRTLKDLAKSMSQLGQFKFSQGGSLLFDNEGNVSGIGPVAVTDNAIHLQYENEGVDFGKTREVGPFSDPAALSTCKLDLHEPQDDDWSRSVHSLTKFFISCLPQGPDPKFVLAHPDFDAQNILVAADGSVTGIIDWDRMETAPRYCGNEAFPLWLMNDWDPANLVHVEGNNTNTKEELVRYRSMYLNFMEEHSNGTEGAPADTINMTKVSLLANCLEFACGRIGEADVVLSKIMREITIAAAKDPRAPEDAKEITVPLIEFLSGKEEKPEKVASSLTYQIGLSMIRGTISEDEMGWLRHGFKALYSS